MTQKLFNITKIGSFTREQAQQVSQSESIVITGKNENGVEIHDMRKLIDRIKTPIRGTGIIYCFGETHFIITEKKLKSLKKQTVVSGQE